MTNPFFTSLGAGPERAATVARYFASYLQPHRTDPNDPPLALLGTLLKPTGPDLRTRMTKDHLRCQQGFEAPAEMNGLMKKLACSAAVLAPLVLLAGCGSSDNSAPAASASAPAASATGETTLATLGAELKRQSKTVPAPTRKKLCAAYEKGDFAPDSQMLQASYNSMATQLAQAGRPLASDVTVDSLSQTYVELLKPMCS